MSLINSIAKKISSNEKTETQHEAISEQCLACGASEQWLVVGTDTWKCYHCQPPPSDAFVADKRGRRIESDDWLHLREHEPVIVCYESQVCPECRGKWIIDTFGDRGSSKCYTCRRTISASEIEAASAKMAAGPS